MTTTSPGTGAAATPPPGHVPDGRTTGGRATTGRATTGRALLRAARQDRGWSQADAARELSALAERTGVVVAGPASLKTQLSRWENGHATPEPEYRALLGTLYDSDPAGLGLATDETVPTEQPGPLIGALAEAETLDDTALGLLREQVAATARLDHRLGPAGAADVLAAQVERLVTLADHVLPETLRRDLCALLAEAALLAGDLERDRARPTVSWSRYGTARAAALEAGRSDLAARAWAGRAGLLLDAGEPDRARTLLGDADDAWAAVVRSTADAADAVDVADTVAGGTTAGSEPASEGTDDPGRTRIDVVRPGLTVEVDAIRHHRNLARAASGDDRARVALERAAGDDAQPVRRRAEASAALALTLRRAGRADDAVTHARRAHLLALRIGAPRIAALVADVLGPEPVRAAGETGAQASVAPARSSSAAR
ncbi:MAG: helix-turn-helix transcriptional regulator [Pseudonocardia sediminis]